MERKLQVDKWLDIVVSELGYMNREYLYKIFMNPLVEIVEHEDKGVIAFLITEGMTGSKEFHEVFFYLKKEHRSFSNLKLIVDRMEELSIKYGCNVIKLGANSGYRDELVLKYLKRRGYRDDTVSKEI